MTWRIFSGNVLICAALLSASAAESLSPSSTRNISLQDFLQMVLERNESLQVRTLELQIAEKRLKAERGIFEPELLLGYDRVENERENTAEQRRSTGVTVFEEENDIYTTGLEALVPTGGRIRLGYTGRDLRNNLQAPIPGQIFTNRFGPEFQTFVGVSLTQPLLKNAWFPATMANIRLAGLAGEVAYQEYRRQLMLVVTTAEAAYWNLYLAQEQVRFFEESARVSDQLVRDNEERFKNGRGSELEVLEARSGLAVRRTKLAEAQQKLFETASQIYNLMSETAGESAQPFYAVDRPKANDPPEFFETGQAAFELNPDYLGQYKKLQQENIRVAFAKNQRLPQLDLKASYGLNGLGSDVDESWTDIQDGGYPSFSAGVELRIPLGGGIRVRNELDAAKLRKKQALVMLDEIRTQILNSITTALRKLRSTRTTISDYEQVLAFSQSLLETELKRLEAGRVDSRRVLEVDAALFEAKNSLLESKVLNERARLELELVQGSVLRDRGLEISRRDLEQRATRLFRDAERSSGKRFKHAPGDSTAAPTENSVRPQDP